MAEKFKKTVWNKTKKESITKGKNPNPTKTIWNKTKKTKTKNIKREKPSSTVWNKTKKVKLTNENLYTDCEEVSSIPAYIRIAFESRGLDPYGSTRPLCEMDGCNKISMDVDHIDGRGGKNNTDNRSEDPRNLIFLCRDCHQNKGGFSWKERAKEIVLSRLGLG